MFAPVFRHKMVRQPDEVLVVENPSEFQLALASRVDICP
jgi:hypothetical protein